MNDQPLRQAIRLIQENEWAEAHELVQTRRDRLACWIHAWLHRQEGDIGNARYWYSCADQPFPENSLEEELIQIASAVGEQ